MITAYIGLGSNLSQPAKQVQQAVAEIAKIAQSKISAVSSVYLSKPLWKSSSKGKQL